MLSRLQNLHGIHIVAQLTAPSRAPLSKYSRINGLLVCLLIQTKKVFAGAWPRVQLVATVLNGFIG